MPTGPNEDNRPGIGWVGNVKDVPPDCDDVGVEGIDCGAVEVSVD